MGRIDDLKEFDTGQYEEGIGIIAGVDEVGRGPIAGDVFAACIIMNKDSYIEGVDDSKKLTHRKRELIFNKILDEATDYSIGIATVEEIDRINIKEATLLAMKRAVEGLRIRPELVLVDGNIKPHISIPCKTVIGGDRSSYNIACASIVAKVLRDGYMKELDEEYPGYGFGKNAGYGTKEHKEGLLRSGITPVHRKQFVKTFLAN